MPTVWVNLGDSIVAVDADIIALLLRRMRDRQEWAREVLRGDVGTDKINTGGIKTESAGSGLGLKVSHFRRLDFFPAPFFLAAATTIDLDTGIAQSANRFFLPASIVDGVGSSINQVYVTLPPSANVHLRLDRPGATGGTVTVGVVAIDF